MELEPGQMEKILEEAGSSEVDERAATELAELLENYIGYITEEAAAQAREDGRKEITEEDVLRAEE